MATKTNSELDALARALDPERLEQTNIVDRVLVLEALMRLLLAERRS